MWIEKDVENCAGCAFLIEPYADRPAHCSRTGSDIKDSPVCVTGRFLRDPETMEEITAMLASLTQKRLLLTVSLLALVVNSPDTSQGN